MIPWESEFTFAGGMHSRVIFVGKKKKIQQSSSFSQDDPNLDLRPAITSGNVV